MTTPQIFVRFVPSWEVEPELPKPPELVLEEGWIKWEGGECPVERHVRVEVLLRGSGRGGEKLLDPRYAKHLGWNWQGRRSDDRIIAYRVIK